MTFKRIRSSIQVLAVTALSLALPFSKSAYVFSDDSVSVSAVVGITNEPPLITSIDPSTSPRLVAKNSYQTFSLRITDSDSPSLLYTISTSSGAIIPSAGTVNVTGGVAQVNFTYFAPSYNAKLVPIFVTLDDQSGNTPIVKQIDVYVY